MWHNLTVFCTYPSSPRKRPLCASKHKYFGPVTKWVFAQRRGVDNIRCTIGVQRLLLRPFHSLGSPDTNISMCFPHRPIFRCFAQTQGVCFRRAKAPLVARESWYCLCFLLDRKLDFHLAAQGPGRKGVQLEGCLIEQTGPKWKSDQGHTTRWKQAPILGSPLEG